VTRVVCVWLCLLDSYNCSRYSKHANVLTSGPIGHYKLHLRKLAVVCPRCGQSLLPVDINLSTRRTAHEYCATESPSSCRHRGLRAGVVIASGSTYPSGTQACFAGLNIECLLMIACICRLNSVYCVHPAAEISVAGMARIAHARCAQGSVTAASAPAVASEWGFCSENREHQDDKLAAVGEGNVPARMLSMV